MPSRPSCSFDRHHPQSNHFIYHSRASRSPCTTPPPTTSFVLTWNGRPGHPGSAGLDPRWPGHCRLSRYVFPFFCLLQSVQDSTASSSSRFWQVNSQPGLLKPTDSAPHLLDHASRFSACAPGSILFLSMYDPIANIVMTFQPITSDGSPTSGRIASLQGQSFWSLNHFEHRVELFPSPHTVFPRTSPSTFTWIGPSDSPRTDRFSRPLVGMDIKLPGLWMRGGDHRLGITKVSWITRVFR